VRQFHDAMRDKMPALRGVRRRGDDEVGGAGDDHGPPGTGRLDLSVVWPVLWLIAKDVSIYIGGGIVLTRRSARIYSE
jgi:hypothetical protein